MFKKIEEWKNRIKEWVVSKTITHAESRFSIFVWMRQINDRILRIEEKKIEAVIQQRAELEMFLDSKIQKLEVRLGMLESQVGHVENVAVKSAEEILKMVEKLKDDKSLKDHEVGELTNELRDVAKKWHGAEQLRARIQRVLVKYGIIRNRNCKGKAVLEELRNEKPC